VKFEKPYSQYVGKAILYDGRHKHFIIKSNAELYKDFVYFNTVCISDGINIKIEPSAGFLKQSPDTELDEISENERLTIIKFIFKSKK
jgi:hypothetical protein